MFQATALDGIAPEEEAVVGDDARLQQGDEGSGGVQIVRRVGEDEGVRHIECREDGFDGAGEDAGGGFQTESAEVLADDVAGGGVALDEVDPGGPVAEGFDTEEASARVAIEDAAGEQVKDLVAVEDGVAHARGGGTGAADGAGQTSSREVAGGDANDGAHGGTT